MVWWTLLSGIWYLNQDYVIAAKAKQNSTFMIDSKFHSKVKDEMNN